MWKQIILGLTTECEFALPVLEDQLATFRDWLGVDLPDDLRSLLLESNGISGSYGLGLVWPVERIAAENAAFRSNTDFRELYMPFDDLLFFADAGNGDQFAFPILDGIVKQTSVFAWNHENDSRNWVAPSLQRYLEWRLSGRIEL